MARWVGAGEGSENSEKLHAPTDYNNNNNNYYYYYYYYYHYYYTILSYKYLSLSSALYFNDYIFFFTCMGPEGA